LLLVLVGFFAGNAKFFICFVEFVIGIEVLGVGFYLVWLHGEWVCLLGYLNGVQEAVEGNGNALGGTCLILLELVEFM
jgi:hypothetical protein